MKAGDVLAEIDPTDCRSRSTRPRRRSPQAAGAARRPRTRPCRSRRRRNASAVVRGAVRPRVGRRRRSAARAERRRAAHRAARPGARPTTGSAQLEKERSQKLVAQGAVSQADFDQRVNAAAASAANVEALRQALAAAQGPRDAAAGADRRARRAASTEVKSNAPAAGRDARRRRVVVRQAALELAKAQLAQAELNLSLREDRRAGRGHRRPRRRSPSATTSRPASSSSPSRRPTTLWVTANFRETQLERMHPGQPATVHVDALDADLHGAVESIGGATGSRFSVLPPENASGNYVKVVQRIPVRIRLDSGQRGTRPAAHRACRVEPKVDGAMSAAAAGRRRPRAASPAYFATGWTGGHNPWVIALVVTMATFMEVLDTSIANVSLPHIAGNLSVSQDESTWVLTSYLVSNAIVLPISGWIATTRRAQALLHDLRGALHRSARSCAASRRRSGGSSSSASCRASAAAASGRASRRSWPTPSRPAKRGMAFAVYGMAVVLAPAIGPTLGGFITDHYSLALGLLHQRAGRHRCRSSCRTASSPIRRTSS